jgi:hypothetical protein
MLSSGKLLLMSRKHIRPIIVRNCTNHNNGQTDRPFNRYNKYLMGEYHIDYNKLFDWYVKYIMVCTGLGAVTSPWIYLGIIDHRIKWYNASLGCAMSAMCGAIAGRIAGIISPVALIMSPFAIYACRNKRRN